MSGDGRPVERSEEVVLAGRVLRRGRSESFADPDERFPSDSEGTGVQNIERASGVELPVTSLGRHVLVVGSRPAYRSDRSLS
jgi:hypothetical protein